MVKYIGSKNLAIDKNGNICICLLDDCVKSKGSCGHVLHQWYSVNDFFK